MNTPKTIEVGALLQQQERAQLTLAALVLGLRNFSTSLASLGIREGYLDEVAWKQLHAVAIQSIKDADVLGLPMEDEAIALNNAVQLFEEMLNDMSRAVPR